MDKMKLEYHSVDVARYWTKDEMNYEQLVTTAVFNNSIFQETMQKF